MINLINNSDIKIVDGFDRLHNLQTGAIMNFHFWYEGKLIKDRFVALHNLVSQWLFVHQTEGQFTHYTIVVSGANELIDAHREHKRIIGFRVGHWHGVTDR